METPKEIGAEATEDLDVIMEAPSKVVVEVPKDTQVEKAKAGLKKKATGRMERADNESRFLSRTAINCRCRPSAVREVLDKVRAIIPEESWVKLQDLNVVQFFNMPPYPQDHIMTMHIINCWDIDRMVFVLGGKEVSFDAYKVALLIGMPNRGLPAQWTKLPCSSVDARQIKRDLLNFVPGVSAVCFEELFLKFLLSNLFFPTSNFRVPKGLLSLCEDVHSFSSHNWPATICNFLIDQVNTCAIKIKGAQSFGYISGFVFLLTIWFYEHTTLVVPSNPDARPRMLRWPTNLSWNAASIQLAFRRLSHAQVNMHLMDLREDEYQLLAISSSDPTCDDIPLILPAPIAQSQPQPPHQDDVNMINIEDVYQLIKEQRRNFFAYQNSVQAQLSSVITNLAELKSEVNALKSEVAELKTQLKIFGKIKNKEESQSRKSIEYSKLRSLIQRVKARENRKKRKFSLSSTSIEEIKDVGRIDSKEEIGTASTVKTELSEEIALGQPTVNVEATGQTDLKPTGHEIIDDYPVKI